MNFLSPTYLWAFLGLLVPIAIHLWSKREGRTILIGSIQLLRRSDSKQSSNLRPNELFLFLLRMSLVSLLILIMAGPQIDRYKERVPIIFLIEPSLLIDGGVLKLLDSLEMGDNIRLLSQDFPEWEGSVTVDTPKAVPNYWQLARHMPDLPADSVVVLTTGLLSGIKGMRPQIPKNVNWIVLGSKGHTDIPVEAMWKGDSINIRILNGDGRTLSFTKNRFPLNDGRVQMDSSGDSITFKDGNTIPLKRSAPVRILIRKVDSLNMDTAYLKASFAALATYLQREFSVSEVGSTDTLDMADFDLVIWSERDPDRTKNTKYLLFRPDSLENKLIKEGSDQNIFYLTDRLDRERIIDQQLPVQLLKLLDVNKDLKEIIRPFDNRVADREMLRPGLKEQKKRGPATYKLEISNYLWIPFLLFLIVERIVARIRKQ